VNATAAQTVPTFEEIFWSDTAVCPVGKTRVECKILVLTNQFGWTDRYAITKTGYLRECGRCQDFSGVLREFGHVFAGVCFLCNGAGVRRSGSAQSVATAIARLERQTRKEIARLAQVEAERPAMEARELEIRKGIAAKAEIAAHAQNDRIEASRYAAEIGSKITVSGEVKVAMYLEPHQYGWSGRMFVIIEGTGVDAGITLKMTSGASSLFGLEKGQIVVVKGSVKDHTTREGIAQTVVERPKVGIICNADGTVPAAE
jgi:hypothetical protein